MARGRYPGAAVTDDALAAIDTAYRVQTPEGVELVLQVAGPAPRALAWLVDAGLQAVGLVTLAFGLSTLGNVGTGVLLIAQFLISWFYPVVYEVLGRGQTPGKRRLGLKVVHEDGTPVGWQSSLTRNLLRVVDLLPAAYLLGLVSMCCDAGFRRLGDLAAGTLVVHASEPKGRVIAAAAAPDAVCGAGGPLRPPVALDLDEQRAVIAFAERGGRLGDARARELAQILGPLLGPCDTREALGRMAAWLLGRPA
jgi:uncharacterized RDD family membrane protein YckC